MQNNYTNKIVIVSLTIIFLSSFLSIIYWQLTGLKYFFFHETTFPLYYAEDILQNKSPISSTFSNRELAPFSWPIVGSLLLLFGGGININTYSLYAISFTVFVLLTSFFYCKILKFKKISSLIFLITIFTVFREKFNVTYHWFDQVWMWPTLGYGVCDFFILISTLLISMVINSDKNTQHNLFSFHRNLFLHIYTIFFILVCFNPGRSLYISIIPFVTSIFLYLILKKNCFAKEYIKIWSMLIYSILIALLCQIIINYLIKDIEQLGQLNYGVVKFNTYLDFNKINIFFYSWFNLFDAIPINSQKLNSIENIKKLLNLFYSLLILIAPIYLLAKDKSLNFVRKIIIYKFIVVLIILLIFNIFTDAAIHQYRYHIPLIYSALFCFPMLIDFLYKKRKIGLILLILIITIINSYGSIKFLTKYNFNSYKKNGYYELSMYLKENNLNFGYGGFPLDLSSVSYFSKNKVKLYLFDRYSEQNGLEPHFHSNKKWYTKKYHNGETFFIYKNPINLDQHNSFNYIIDFKAYNKIRKNKINTFFYEDWVIDLYSSNIFCIEQ